MITRPLAGAGDTLALPPNGWIVSVDIAAALVERRCSAHAVRVRDTWVGVPQVPQKAIATDESFTCEFARKALGPLWFYVWLRSSEQVERRFYGGLVVEDREPVAHPGSKAGKASGDHRIALTARMGGPYDIEPMLNGKDMRHDGARQPHHETRGSS